MMLARMSSSLSRTTGRPVHDVRGLLSYRLALLARINDRVGQAEVATPFGITLGEWRVLAVIGYLGEAALRAVARELRLDEGQVSRSVKVLAGRGLIVRRMGSGDRRSLRLALSPSGRTLHRRVLARAQEVNLPANYGLTPAEIGELMGLLDKALAHLAEPSAKTSALEGGAS
jgi:DNA-binding MarR family transcriptional regulator